MDTYKMAKKYCTNDKVQVMFSNALSQIICSKDGYLYLRDGDVTVHKYLTDSQRKKMPYHNKPSGKWHAAHLFKYDQVYVKFTRYRRMNDCILPMSDGYSLSFLYFYKVGKGEAIVSEMYLSDFNKEEGEMTFTKEELRNFLYESSGVKGKYIFEWLYGIKYAKSVGEEISIDKNFLDLSDNFIIDLYNFTKAPIHFNIFDDNEEKEDDESWKVSSIDDITEEFTLTNGFYAPILVEVNDTAIIVFEFEVTYCSKNCFRVKYEKVVITPNLVDILTSAVTSDYTRDPF